MKNSIKATLIWSVLATLGISGLAKANYVNQTPSPVAIMPQHHSSTQMLLSQETNQKPDSINDNDAEVNDETIPTSLSKVSEEGENIYDMAKVNDWSKTSASLTSLENAAKSLHTQIQGKNKPELAQLDSRIAALKGTVTTKNRLATMQNGNQVTLIAAQITKQFEPKVPVEITLLDYYGRELEIWSATGNTGKLKVTANEMRLTWDAVRPSILAHKADVEAQKFDALVASVQAAKSPQEYNRLATPVLNQVDTLEKVFK